MFEDSDAICPYYVKAYASHNYIDRIRCEGLMKGQKIEMVFTRKEELEKYKLLYCDSFHCKNCKMFKMLDKIYDRS